MQNPTLLGYCTEVYLPTRVGLKPSSAQQLRLAAKLYNLPLTRLHERELAGALAEYCRSHSPATTNSKRRAILTLWDAAAGDGLCRKPDRRRVPKAREFRRLPPAWTVSEVERLVSHCRALPGMVAQIPRSRWWTSLVLAVWDSGERISATLSTATADCNLAERFMLVRAENQKCGIDRLFWLSDATVAAIAGHYDTGRQLVWPWPHCRRYLFVQFRSIIGGAGLTAEKSMGLFHKLRRSNISYTARNGGLDLARQQAGHSSASTTLRHYVDPRIAHERSAVDVLPPLRADRDVQLRLF